MAEIQEFPKMLYHSKTKAPRVVNSAEEETRVKSQGFSNDAPAQFDENGNVPADQNPDPTAEPAIVSELEQQATRLAGNQGAKDPADLLKNEENGDESSEDSEPAPAAPKKKASK